jgi:hypothetical protein
VPSFLLPLSNIVFTCFARLERCMVHNPNRFFLDLVTKSIQTRHNHRSMYGLFKHIRVSIILPMQQTYHVYPGPFGGRHVYDGPRFLPSLWHRGG